MLIAKSPSSGSGPEGRKRWRACRLGITAVFLSLVACNPVETWRDWTGASQNDPDPDTTPNKENLAAGAAADYPNLATVPSPPVRAMTAAEREKLTQSLIADRANARYSDEQLRASFSTAAAAPPPAASSAPTAEPQDAQSGAVAAAAAPPPAPSGSATTSIASASPPATSVPGSSGTAPAASALPHAASTASTAAPGDTSAGPFAGAASQSAQASGKTRAGAKGSLRKPGEPPEPGPMESSLEVPQARATPQPEQVEAAPPPPQLPPPSQVASTASPIAGGLAAGGALAPVPLPQAKAAAGFEAAPAVPELPPPAPTRAAAAEPGKGSQKPPPPAGTPVAEVKFAADSTSLTEGDRQKLETVVPLYQQSPGKVRIVGYAEAASGAVEQLNGYRTALDRAQAVAAALTHAGIPSDKIQVEAAPSGADSGESRAEVILEH